MMLSSKPLTLMGVPGMILAPVILHYIKMETSRVAVDHKAEESASVEPPVG